MNIQNNVIKVVTDLRYVPLQLEFGCAKQDLTDEAL